jgi:hypothetical protein
MDLINTDYTIGIKQQIVTALEPMFHSPSFPFPELKDRVYVGLQYPFTQTEYPAIYITFAEEQLRSAGVGHFEQITDSQGTTQLLKHWYFTGRLNFNIMALSPLERDKVGSALVNIVAFADTDSFLDKFKKAMLNEQFIDLQYLQEIIHPGGEVTGDTPWGAETEMVFGLNYYLDVLGEFYSNLHSGELVQWEYVQVHPYDPEQGGAPIF